MPHSPYRTVPLIRHPTVDPNDYSIQLFRRTFDLVQDEPSGVVWITACQRFEMFLDGVLLARGPSRSDPTRWHVSRIAIHSLSSGRHVVGVRVINWGRHAGIGQLGDETFLLLAADSSSPWLRPIETSSAWTCIVDSSTSPIDEPEWVGGTPYFVAGCSDRVTTQDLQIGWAGAGFDDSAWMPALEIASAWDNPWGRYPGEVLLRDDPLPPMAEEAHEWLRGPDLPLRVEAGEHLDTVLDAGILVNAWPSIRLRGGEGARLTLIWSEAPYDADGRKKPRDQWHEAHFCGPVDEYLLDGREHDLSTTWYRSFRYLHIRVAGGSTTLEIESVHLARTFFPLERPRLSPPAGANLGAESEQRLWEACWQTIRNCAHETIMDCPHYEQAQFPGDARIQAIYQYALCGEFRLGRKAIDDLHASRLPDGILQCRFPSRQVQIIPTFGLYWIMMLEDYARFSGDARAMSDYIAGAIGVIEWFERRLRADGLLGLVPHAPFIDWSVDFPAGNAPQGEYGGSSILTCLLARAQQSLARLLSALGETYLSERYASRAADLVSAVRALCQDAESGCIRDHADAPFASQHAQIEAVLAGVVTGAAAARLIEDSLDETRFRRIGTLYYRFYQIEALLRVGANEAVAATIAGWSAAIDRERLETLPEVERPNPRSDNHAWGVTPALVMAGVRWWDESEVE